MWAKEEERVAMVPPGLKRVTCLPTDSTVPAPSEPGTVLSFIGKGYLPLGMMRSR